MSKSTTKTRTATAKPTRWRTVSSTMAPDPRVSEDSAEHGKRVVLISTLIDDDGQLWERVGRDPPTLLGRPPATRSKG